ncbi:MAG: S8 family serine peptidase [Verrucomicrobiales bacterium]
MSNGTNWGMKFIRAPQLWNFNKAIEKRLNNGQSNRITKVGVVDAGINPLHPEFRNLPITLVGTQRPDRLVTPDYIEHGNHITGIIAAPHGDGGIDGVTPFATISYSGNAYVAEFSSRTSFGQVSAVLIDLAEATPVRVINMSIGYASSIRGRASVRDDVREWGKMFAQKWVESPRPLLVVTAGNVAAVAAQDNSPAGYAALALSTPGILVVENLTTGMVLSADSGRPGNISAPGTEILSCGFPSPYLSLSGTSMAAPHVAGAIAYLFSLKPSLTNSQVETLLAANRNANGNGKALDAWAAALDIDRVAGGIDILRMWCDFDDGTLDGNQRRVYSVDLDADEMGEDPTAPEVARLFDDDVDGDGGIGDGRTDMADFRRYRDWASIVLAEENQLPFPAGLDGSSFNPKHDPNQNGVPNDGSEQYYPRTDLNGDGFGSWLDSPATIPGIVAGSRTDLQVLQTIFSDPYYESAELPGLAQDSADIHFNFYWFAKYAQEHGSTPDLIFVDVTDVANPANSKGIISIPTPSSLSPHGSDLVLTFKTNSTYRVRVWGFAGEVELVGEARNFIFATPLQDHWFSARAFEGFTLD